MDKTAIVVVNYRTPWHLNLCLSSVFQHTSDFHIFLVHNSPDNRSLEVGEYFKLKYPRQIDVIVNKQNLGYVGGVNSAYEKALEYSRICLLNSDTIVTKDWLLQMNKVFDEHEDVVQVCPDTNSHYPQSRIWKLISALPGDLSKVRRFEVYFNKPKHSSREEGFNDTGSIFYFPGGYCNLFRSRYFAKLGYFLDPNIVHGYWDDFDHSMYLRQFGKVGSVPSSFVFHFLNASLNQNKNIDSGMKRQIMLLNGLYVMDKWKDQVRAALSRLSIADLTKLISESYVVEMAVRYFGVCDLSPEAVNYLKQLPAKKIGAEFLK